MLKWNALHSAAARGNIHDINNILDLGSCHINGCDGNGQNPIHVTAFTGELSATVMLIARGGEFQSADINGVQPIHIASDRGHLKIVETLVQHGASTTCKDIYGNSPLHRASVSGQVEVMKFLLDDGAAINQRNEKAETPLHCAAKHGHKSAVRLLMDREAKSELKNNESFTPLHMACDSGQLDVVRVMLGYDRVKVKAKTRHGKTPLDLARDQCELEIEELLESHIGSERVQEKRSHRLSTPKVQSTFPLMEGEESVPIPHTNSSEKAPNTASSGSFSRVLDMLASLGITHHADKFFEAELDDSVLPMLNAEALQQSGIPVGPSLKIMNHIKSHVPA